MKKILLYFLTGWLLCSVVNSKSPDKISYQAVVRNEANQLVVSQPVGVRLSILKGSVNGMLVYSERQQPVTNPNGLFSLVIGDDTAQLIMGSLTEIEWSEGPYFILSEIDPSGGFNYSLSGTSQLLSVPYALYASEAESLTGELEETDPKFENSPASMITDADIEKIAHISGTNTGDQEISHLVDFQSLGDSLAILRNQIPDTADWLKSETDPTFGASVAAAITMADTILWNNKQELLFAGDGIRIEGNKIRLNQNSHYVGELYGGGVVFWVDHSGQHGLVVSMVDIGSGQNWGPVSLVGVQAQSDWNGIGNSEAIASASSATNAASTCLVYQNVNYGTGVFSDWYLPSRGELVDLWNSLRAVQKALEMDGNSDTQTLSRQAYWSSTEYNNNSAWYYFFTYGYSSYGNKNQNFYVRAIRAF